jgi:hypothetical protein
METLPHHANPSAHQIRPEGIAQPFGLGLFTADVFIVLFVGHFHGKSLPGQYLPGNWFYSPENILSGNRQNRDGGFSMGECAFI